MTLEDAPKLPATFKSCALWGKLIGGIRWLWKALQVLAPHNCGQFELISAEEVVLLYEVSNVIRLLLVYKPLESRKYISTRTLCLIVCGSLETYMIHITS